MRINHNGCVCVKYIHTGCMIPCLFHYSHVLSGNQWERQQKVVWRSFPALPAVVRLFWCSSADICVSSGTSHACGVLTLTRPSISVRCRIHLLVTCVMFKVNSSIPSRFRIYLWIKSFFFVLHAEHRVAALRVKIRKLQDLIILSCISAEKMKYLSERRCRSSSVRQERRIRMRNASPHSESEKCNLFRWVREVYLKGRIKGIWQADHTQIPGATCSPWEHSREAFQSSDSN